MGARAWVLVSVAGAAACAAGVWVLLTPPSPAATARLLAKAYGEVRPFDLRFSPSPHREFAAPPGSISPVKNSLPFAEATLNIKKHLTRDPDNPDWLDLDGRAAMLDWQYDPAVDSLRRASAARPTDPQILADLGCAYALRARQPSADPGDYDRAINALGKSLQARPGVAETLFDQALVYEERRLYSEAMRTWRQYLTLDPSGAWADEARRHMSSVEGKAVRWKLKSALARTPEVFLQQVSQNVETYPDVLAEDLAFSQWRGQPKEMEALSKLGELVNRRHHDAWLTEALADSKAFAQLGDAIRANLELRYGDATEPATAVGRSYRAKRNQGGWLRAEVERVYALQRSRKGEECVQSARGLLPLIPMGRYAWSRVQLRLSLAACSYILGGAGFALAASEQAIQEAHDADYGSLELRADSFAADYRGLLGGRGAMTARTLAALDIWWAGPYRGLRGQNLFLNMNLRAEQSSDSYAAWVYHREALAAIQDEDNKDSTTISRVFDALAALQAGDSDVARQEVVEASASLASTSPSRNMKRAQEETRVIWASALSEIDASLALSILQRVSTTQTPVVEARKNMALGSLYARAGRTAEAEHTYLEALSLLGAQAASGKASERLAAISPARPAASALTWMAIQRGDWSAAFDIWQEFRAGDTASRSIESPPDGEIFLSYAVLAGGVVAWVQTGQQRHGIWLGEFDMEGRELVARFARQCASVSTPQADWQQSARHLYNWLVAPIEPWLGRSGTLVIQTDDFLEHIPFAALLDHQERTLGERFALVSVDSVAAYRRRASRDSRLSARSRVVVMANPELRGRTRDLYPPLGDAEIEAEDIRRQFQATQIFRRETATVLVLKNVARVAQLVHFGGHGIGNLASGGLLLAPVRLGEAEVVDAAHVEGDWSAVDLLTLAACSTAGVGEGENADPNNLVRSFLAAGARRVLAARWSVDSRTTRDLMVVFYGSVASGSQPAEALRAAAARIRAVHPHPHDWAAFELFGYR